jgi:transcriptional regulator with XRE-family HTH domain
MMSSKNNTAELEAQIGERIRSRRIRAGVSQENLGKPLAVSFQQIQKYEKGTNRVSAGRLLKIAEVLECNVTDFFEGLQDSRTTSAAEILKILGYQRGHRNRRSCDEDQNAGDAPHSHRYR